MKTGLTQLWLWSALQVLAATQALAAEPVPLRIVAASIKEVDLADDPACAAIHMVIALEAWRRLGQPVVCESAAWPLAQAMVEKGERDGLVTMYTERRQRYSQASKEVVFYSGQLAVVPSWHPDLKRLETFTSIDQFKPYPIILYKGDGWGAQRLAVNGFKVEWTDTVAESYRRLAASSNAITFGGDYFIRSVLRQLPEKNQLTVLSTKPFELIEYRMLIGNHSPVRLRLNDFDKTIRDMNADGTIQSLVLEHAGAF